MHVSFIQVADLESEPQEVEISLPENSVCELCRFCLKAMFDGWLDRHTMCTFYHLSIYLIAMEV